MNTTDLMLVAWAGSMPVNDEAQLSTLRRAQDALLRESRRAEIVAQMEALRASLGGAPVDLSRVEPIPEPHACACGTVTDNERCLDCDLADEEDAVENRRG